MRKRERVFFILGSGKNPGNKLRWGKNHMVETFVLKRKEFECVKRMGIDSRITKNNQVGCSPTVDVANGKTERGRKGGVIIVDFQKWSRKAPPRNAGKKNPSLNQGSLLSFVYTWGKVHRWKERGEKRNVYFAPRGGGETGIDPVWRGGRKIETKVFMPRRKGRGTLALSSSNFWG